MNCGSAEHLIGQDHVWSVTGVICDCVDRSDVRGAHAPETASRLCVIAWVCEEEREGGGGADDHCGGELRDPSSYAVEHRAEPNADERRGEECRELDEAERELRLLLREERRDRYGFCFVIVCYPAPYRDV